MSNLLRAEAIAVLERPDAGAAPRVFGASRRLPGHQVGLERPISLSVPRQPRLQVVDAEPAAEEEPTPPSPPDFSALEEAARVQGYEVGYEQGRAAGLQAAEQVMAESLARLQAIVAGVQEQHATFFRAAERQVVDLALQIAQRVVERQIENIPDLAADVIHSALEEMDARTAVRVRVCPDDVEVLQRRWSQVVPSGVAADRIELVADERIGAGGAVIETTRGEVDAQLDTKLAQLGNALWTFVMDVESETGSSEADTYAA